MELNKYSEIKQGNSLTIGSYAAKKANSSSSGSSSSNKSVGLDRIIWGQDDDGGDLDGDLTCGGNIYIVDNYDDNEDDDENEEEYIGATRKQEPIMALSIADDLKDKFDNDEGGNLYVKRQLVADEEVKSKEIYGNNIYVDYNNTKTNIIDLLLPIGSIIMFNGSSPIPDGWAVCNGTKGTPNLVNRFVIGCGSVSDIGRTGGVTQTSLTVDNLPPHTHTAKTTLKINNAEIEAKQDQYIPTLDEIIYSKIKNGENNEEWIMAVQNGRGEDLNLNGISAYDLINENNYEIETTIEQTGGGVSFTNLPPFYSLIYIMRIS